MSTSLVVLPPKRNLKVISASAVTPVADFRKEVHNTGAPLTIQMVYQNHFPFPIHMIERNGMVTTIPARSRASTDKSGISIIKTYSFVGGVIIDATSLLHSANASPELKAMREAMSLPQPKTFGSDTSFSICYRLDQSAFEYTQGDVYLPELDMLFTTQDPSLTSHPYSDMNRNYAVGASSVGGAFIHFVVNDPEYKMPSALYLNLNGEIFKLAKEVDELKSTGVYVYRHGLDGDPPHVVTCERLSYEDAIAKFPLFTSHSEAYEYGSLQARLERDVEHQKDILRQELLRKEAEVKLQTLDGQTVISNLKIETEERSAKLKEQQTKQAEEQSVIDRANKELEHQHYLQRMEIDRQSKLLESQLKQFAAEREHMLADVKQQMAIRSAHRQDGSEILKWLPAALLGVGLLLPKMMG